MSAWGYTRFISDGVFQRAWRTTAYQDSRPACESACLCQNCSRAPRLMMRIYSEGSHKENRESIGKSLTLRCERRHQHKFMHPPPPHRLFRKGQPKPISPEPGTPLIHVKP